MICGGPWVTMALTALCSAHRPRYPPMHVPVWTEPSAAMATGQRAGRPITPASSETADRLPVAATDSSSLSAVSGDRTDENRLGELSDYRPAGLDPADGERSER